MFFSQRHQRIALIFDIGGGSVGAAVVRYRQGALPEVLLSRRREYLFLEDLAFERFVVSMVQALEAIVEDIAVGARAVVRVRSVHDIVIVYASPWYVAETQFVHDGEEKTFVVTRSYLDHLGDRARQQFVASHEEDRRYDDLLFFEQSRIETRLNGYETTAPLGKSARAVDSAFFISGMSEVLHRRIQTVLDRAYPHAKRHDYASNQVLFYTLRHFYTDLDDFLFLHIGGEVTDLSIVRDGVLLATVSFPFGEHTLIRKTTQGLKTVPAETRTLLRTSVPGTAPPQPVPDAPDTHVAGRLQEVVGRARAPWGAMLEKALQHIGKDGSVPRTCFIATESPIGAWFAGLVKIAGRSTPGEDLRASGMFLSEQVLTPHARTPANEEIDFFLMLESVFFGDAVSY